MAKPQFVILFGPAGSGKSTLFKKYFEGIKFEHFDIDKYVYSIIDRNNDLIQVSNDKTLLDAFIAKVNVQDNVDPDREAIKNSITDEIRAVVNYQNNTEGARTVGCLQRAFINNINDSVVEPREAIQILQETSVNKCLQKLFAKNIGGAQMLMQAAIKEQMLKKSNIVLDIAGNSRLFTEKFIESLKDYNVVLYCTYITSIDELINRVHARQERGQQIAADDGLVKKHLTDYSTNMAILASKLHALVNKIVVIDTSSASIYNKEPVFVYEKDIDNVTSCQFHQIKFSPCNLLNAPPTPSLPSRKGKSRKPIGNLSGN